MRATLYAGSQIFLFSLNYFVLPDLENILVFRDFSMHYKQDIAISAYPETLDPFDVLAQRNSTTWL